MNRFIKDLPKDPEAKFCRIPSEELFRVWDGTAEIMTKHPRGLLNVMSLLEVHNAIQVGMYDLWVGIKNQHLDMALITSYTKHTHKSFLYIIWGGGNGKEYWELGAHHLERFAQMIGASEIRCHGRPGLQKWGERLGFIPEEIVMVKHVPTYGNEWRH